MGKRSLAAWLLLVLVASAGTAAVLVVTREGPGLSPDSVRYVAGARSILEGRGFAYQDGAGRYRPITNWPPLYPAVLALPGLAGVDALPAARVIDAVLFGLTLLMVGWLVRRRSGSLGAALLAMAALAGVRTAFVNYVMAWSEPLFVGLTVAALIALTRHLERPSWGRLLLASLAAGAAFMTRYPGIGLVAAGSLALLLWRRGGWWPRLRDGAAFGALACLPVFLWMNRNVEAGGSATGRRMAPRLIDVPHLLEGWETVRSWLVPARLTAELKPVVTYTLIAGAVTFLALPLLGRRKTAAAGPGPERPARVIGPLLLFVAAYVGALIGAMTFVRPSCDLGTRYLYPILPVLIVVLTCAACDGLRPARGAPVARLVLIVAGLVFVGANLLQTVPWGGRGAGVRHRVPQQFLARLAHHRPACRAATRRAHLLQPQRGGLRPDRQERPQPAAQRRLSGRRRGTGRHAQGPPAGRRRPGLLRPGRQAVSALAGTARGRASPAAHPAGRRRRPLPMGRPARPVSMSRAPACANWHSVCVI